MKIVQSAQITAKEHLLLEAFRKIHDTIDLEFVLLFAQKTAVAQVSRAPELRLVTSGGAA